MVPETLVYSPFKYLMRLLTREKCIEFICLESFKLYDLDFIRFDIAETHRISMGQILCCLCQTKRYSGRIFQVIMSPTLRTPLSSFFFQAEISGVQSHPAATS